MKKLPIGVDDFKNVIDGNLYYVDKTEVIEELSKQQFGTFLFPRPRRFGKSLFMSMLENFFDIDKKEENKDLFNNLYISKSEYYSELSKYPTIHLDFKSLKQSTYESAYNQFKMLMSELYKSKDYVLEVLDETEKEKYYSFENETASLDEYKVSRGIVITSKLCFLC